LRALQEGGVQFVLVGGLAAVLDGAPVNTFDVDIVPASDEENLTKLFRVLESMDAIFRIQPHRRFKPDMSHLRSKGHKNLDTTYGHLDVLGTIGRGLTYDDLLPHSVEMDLGGIHIRVLDLPTIIALKEELRGEKDLAVLPILRRTLEEKRRAETSRAST
jgi:predicted nucleotidyltransferase